MEIWASVIGFGNYEVSDQGRVRIKSTKRIMILQKDKDGYLVIGLTRDRKQHQRRVHRLVAMAFSSCDDYSLEINHEDGVKSNASIDNLEWVTSSQNRKHAYRLGLQKPHNKAIPFMIAKTKKRVRIIETGEVFDSVSDCARYLKVVQSNVSRVIDKTHLTVKGYTICYVD